MSSKSIAAAILILIAGGGLIVWQKTREPSPTQQATTTAPDERPIPTENGPTMILGLGETGVRGDISITPQKPVNDSRCPKDVQCVWAGTVSVSALVKSGSQESTKTFALGTPILIEGREVTLVDVTPYPTARAGIDPAMYRFTFEVKQ